MQVSLWERSEWVLESTIVYDNPLQEATLSAIFTFNQNHAQPPTATIPKHFHQYEPLKLSLKNRDVIHTDGIPFYLGSMIGNR